MSVWYWEVVEMIRKLILTSVLVVVYNGSPPHLAGSLLTTFFFLVMHLQVHPYLNQGLNNFQRLALVVQFLTIFGAILFLMIENMDSKIEEDARESDVVARNMVGYMIWAINWFVVVIYPFYRTVLFMVDWKISLSAMAIRWLGRQWNFILGVGTLSTRDAELERKQDDEKVRVVCARAKGLPSGNAAQVSCEPVSLFPCKR